MIKSKTLVIALSLVLVLAFSLAVLAEDMIKGKVEAFDKNAKKITISGKQYSLSDEAAKADVKVGDEVEAAAEGEMVKKLTKKAK